MYETFVPTAPAVDLVLFDVARPVVNSHGRLVCVPLSLSAATHAAGLEKGWVVFRPKAGKIERRSAKYSLLPVSDDGPQDTMLTDKDYLDYWRYIVDIVE